MFELNVNGKLVQCETDKKLLSFLRDDLKITSAKDGCSEGACGTCTILVDGKAVKACVQKVSKFVGKKILTVEGFEEHERAVYEYCFGAAGAVQCGFCIPGMVICAKALLDVNPDPTSAGRPNPGTALSASTPSPAAHRFPPGSARRSARPVPAAGQRSGPGAGWPGFPTLSTPGLHSGAAAGQAPGRPALPQNGFWNSQTAPPGTAPPGWEEPDTPASAPESGI